MTNAASSPEVVRYYEDFEVGGVQDTPSRLVEPQDLDTYAALTRDGNPLHLDDEAARRAGFDRRVAHGVMITSIAAGLLQRTGIESTGRGLLETTSKFRRPVFAGDTIRARQTVASMRETKRPEVGLIVFEYEVLNQDDEVVQTGTRTNLIARRD